MVIRSWRTLRSLAHRGGWGRVMRMVTTKPNRLLQLARHDARTFQEDQSRRFAAVGLEYGAAVAATRAALSGRRHGSEHYPLFAGWAEGRQGLDVLEIGTDTAEFSRFLAALPGVARVVTVDLPATDARYRAAVIRDGIEVARGLVPSQRSTNLTESKIEFVECNSIKLTWWDRRFDAIWVDGDHTNPVVTIDAVNALRLLRPGGLLAFDDVRLDDAWESRFGGAETWRTIDALQSTGLVDVQLIYKRMTPNFLAIPEIRKYIAVVRPATPGMERGD